VAVEKDRPLKGPRRYLGAQCIDARLAEPLFGVTPDLRVALVELAELLV
jgi:hypothetical protein